MDLQLADLGTTFATGAYVLALVEGLLLVFVGNNILNAVKFSEVLGGSTRAVFLLGIFSFAIGMLAEDLSNKFADVDPPANCKNFWQFQTHPECTPTSRLLDSEKQLRRDAIVGPTGKLNALGRELAALGLFGEYAGEAGLALEASVSAAPKAAVDAEHATSAANALYYFAKNTIYREDNYYDELKHIQIRIDFSRSVAIVSVAMLLPTILLAMVTCLMDAARRYRAESKEGPERRYILRGLAACFCLALAYLAARTAYAAEELEFDKRVFGYFASLQRATDPTASALPHGATPAISGMVSTTPGVFLTVHDVKSGDPSARIGKLYVTATGVTYEAVTTDWSATGEPSDLEAVCIDPVHPDDLLCVESGGYRDRPGKLFRVRMENGSFKSVASVLLPADTHNIEGVACATADDGSTLIILGERGHGAQGKSGQLRWAKLTETTSALQIVGEMTVRPPDVAWSSGGKEYRDIADLYLDGKGMLWGVGTEDPDRDMGPFQSVVYPIATVTPLGATAVPEATIRYRLAGLKVEALAGPAVFESEFSIGTDDEGLGGVWRPLG